MEKAVELSIKACQVAEQISIDTKESREDKRDYMFNLRSFYSELTGDVTEEGFEEFYQKAVLDGEEWNALKEDDDRKWIAD